MVLGNVEFNINCIIELRSSIKLSHPQVLKRGVYKGLGTAQWAYFRKLVHT